MEGMKYCMTLGYKFIVKDCEMLNTGNLMMDFFKDGYQCRLNAKKEGKSGVATTYKILINSGYGFFALCTERQGKILIKAIDSMEYYNLIKEGKLQSISLWENNQILKVDTDYDDNVDVNVAVAAYITEYARIYLHQVIEYYEKNGIKVLYCDTDSVVLHSESRVA